MGSDHPSTKVYDLLRQYQRGELGKGCVRVGQLDYALTDVYDAIVGLHRPADTPAPEPVREPLCAFETIGGRCGSPESGGRHICNDETCSMRPHNPMSGCHPFAPPAPVTEQGECEGCTLGLVHDGDPCPEHCYHDCCAAKPPAPSAAEPEIAPTRYTGNLKIAVDTLKEIVNRTTRRGQRQLGAEERLRVCRSIAADALEVIAAPTYKPVPTPADLARAEAHRALDKYLDDYRRNEAGPFQVPLDAIQHAMFMQHMAAYEERAAKQETER